MSLAAFHTLFIGVGVVLFLPWVHTFARGIERLLPDRGPALTRHLDDTVLQAPPVALEATRRALGETAAELFRALRDGLASTADGSSPALEHLRAALDRLREFFPKIPPTSADEPHSPLRVALMHALDHLAQLQTRLPPPANVRRALGEPRLQPAADLARAILTAGETGLRDHTPAGWLREVEQQAAQLAQLRRERRSEILEHTADGKEAPARALDLLDAIRWLDRVGYHAWRLCHHLEPVDPTSLPLTDATDHPEA
jgi:phosphate:Na+ symporter